MTDKPQAALLLGAGNFLGGAMARRFAREGFHVVGARRRGALEPLDRDSTRALSPDCFEKRTANGIMRPDDLAEIYWQLHRQPRSAWTFETDVRTSVEPW